MHQSSDTHAEDGRDLPTTNRCYLKETKEGHSKVLLHSMLGGVTEVSLSLLFGDVIEILSSSCRYVCCCRIFRFLLLQRNKIKLGTCKWKYTKQ